MNEDELRSALRGTMTIDQPPPMASGEVITAGRRAVRRRAVLSCAGAAAAIALVAGSIAAVPHRSATAPVAPAASKATASVSPASEKPEDRLLDQVLASVPEGYHLPTPRPAEGLPMRDSLANGSGNQRRYVAYTMIAAADGKTGKIVVQVDMPGNEMPSDPCELAEWFQGSKGVCLTVVTGDAKVGVMTSMHAGGLADQWAAYRYPDGTVVFAGQSRNHLPSLPLSSSALASLAVDPRFHL